ncbi:glyceraldehyde-3-phosphate dehydrogenase [Paenibacillus mucilaginosus 3016]|uniref:Glyceraldehyde-3-phosphate dehydrogenase n=1 Tax=Paenibacillus mucilaginosus 3016 TaxID=1116391 RepID=H6NHI5_9BACL|nr:type I glyceraldehyde-3-phosphate dehydrogenase [Paenibacillus mucilaginosus]AFC29582.1 glyceraldehyde-3-phosphate dehydrogenase [Paenibacillus mucilaginosus 3016]WFA18268.1 type I glyceraldehyde-3-phosphate dehydrogenase [Paenibacillus mucilaginosus]
MKVTKSIGISGMGRIGRLLVRRLFSGEASGLALKAINCVYPAETVAHLLKYDTVHGRWDADVSVEDGNLIINGQSIRIVGERDPEKLPWGELGVTLVLDATGKFNNREGAAKHLAAGAAEVILTAPGKDVDLTIVMGVNDGMYDPGKHRILSAASCTTNCLSPVLHILDRAFGVTGGWMTTVHSFTSDQNHLDNPHKDLRRARACTQSIVPTSTGVGKALGDVLPHLAPHIQGLSLRVPTQDVSLVDLTVQVRRSTDAAEVRGVFREAAQGAFARYLGYTEEPLVSVDFIGNSKSAVVDGLSVAAMENQIKVLAWYDNEWAYACRVVELAELTAERNVQPWQSAVLA